MHVQSDTLLLADVFENFRNMCIKTYELVPEKFLWAPGWACQAAFKKTKVKLDLLTDIGMLLRSFYTRQNVSGMPQRHRFFLLLHMPKGFVY